MLQGQGYHLPFQISSRFVFFAKFALICSPHTLVHSPGASTDSYPDGTIQSGESAWQVDLSSLAPGLFPVPLDDGNDFCDGEHLQKKCEWVQCLPVCRIMQACTATVRLSKQPVSLE